MKAETVETDVLIIGGGAAGCCAALRAHELGAKVLMVVKGKMGRSGGTPLAASLSARARLPLPYPLFKPLKQLYSSISEVVRLPMPAKYEKTLRAALESHYWLVDQDYFLDLALWLDKEFFPSLEASGIYVLRDDEGNPEVPPGNRPQYAMQAYGFTGFSFGESKRKEVLAKDIKVIEEAMAFSMLRGEGGEVAGAMVLDYVTGRLYEVVAKTTILATGHTNWLGKRSSGTREMAANGLAMALRAGAELENLEIQWYHVSDMAYPDSWMRLHNFPNPLHGNPDRAVMVNAEGEKYMKLEDYGKESILIMPYTIQMKRLYEQVKLGKAEWGSGNFTDFRHFDQEAFKKYVYQAEFYEKLGKDTSKDLLESVPSWHMSAGGVRVNIGTMKTDVPRLYIAGAVGGHQLGGLPFASFDGAIAGAGAARSAPRLGLPKRVPEQVGAAEERLDALLSGPARERNVPGIAPIQVKKRIREIVWNDMMYEKSETGLKDAMEKFAKIEQELAPNMRLRSGSTRFNYDLVDALDVQDMLEVCQITAHACLTRQESRGPHFREEFPFTDNDNWLKRIVVSREGDQVKTRFDPVQQKYLRPKPGKIDYFDDPYV